MATELSPIVGREQALATLAALQAEARAGRGRLVLITGEAGIGKTRLAEELVRRSTDATTHWAWCRVDQTMGSLRTWSSVLRALTATVPSVAELAEESPVLRSLVAGTSPGTVHPEAGRGALAGDVSRALALAAAATPRLIVLDDLHDAEASTLRLLLDVSAELRTLPLLVVGTARDTGWSGSEQLRADLLHQAVRVPLSPLTEADVRELVPDADARLFERTGGNPLLVTELARSDEDVPTSLRGLVNARLDALDPTTREVLRGAAVLGPRFRLDVLAEVAGLALDDLGAHLSHDLVRATTAGEARFTHELLRDAVYQGIPHADLAGWHTRAGLVLDHLLQRRRLIAPAEVATHLLLAGPEHDQLAVTRCLDAAANAEQMQAFEDAVHWHHQALDRLDDPAAQAEVLVRRARARRGLGDFAGAREDLLLAGSLAQQANRPDLLAHAALGLGTGPGGFEVDLEDVAQLDLLERALAALPDDDLPLRAAVTARLSLAGARVGTPADQRRLAEEAVALGRASGDPISLGVALAALCDAVAGPDQVAERLTHAGEVIELATTARDGDLELLGRRLRLVALLELGQRQEAEREVLAYELRAREVRHPTYLWFPPLWRSLWAMAEGRFAESAALLDESLRIGVGSPNAELLNVVARWSLHSLRDDRAALREVFTGFDLAQLTDLWAHVTRALLSVELGETAEARASLDLAADRLDEVPWDSEWLPTMAQAALVVEGLGGHPCAPHLYALMEPYAELFAVEGIGAALRGPMHLFLAKCAPDQATADVHRARAEELLRGVGAIALLGEPAVLPAGTGSGLVREGEVWAFTWNGRETRLKDSKGMRDLAALLAAPGRELAALDLYGGQAPLEHDTGEVLDATAREDYKRRLTELEAEPSLSEAEALERELLLQQLSQAYGLGGRVRRTGSSVEKARSAVTARLRDTLKRVEAADPELGRHLRHSVRTGTFCRYTPESPVDWRLTP